MADTYHLPVVDDAPDVTEHLRLVLVKTGAATAAPGIRPDTGESR